MLCTGSQQSCPHGHLLWTDSPYRLCQNPRSLVELEYPIQFVAAVFSLGNRDLPKLKKQTINRKIRFFDNPQKNDKNARKHLVEYAGLSHNYRVSMRFMRVMRALRNSGNLSQTLAFDRNLCTRTRCSPAGASRSSLASRFFGTQTSRISECAAGRMPHIQIHPVANVFGPSDVMHDESWPTLRR